MRAAIVNPYLDTLGGGERYTLTFAKVLQDRGWKVDIQWDNTDILSKISTRFGIGSKFTIVPNVDRGDGYDLCFWVSDGSIPLLKSKKNVLHFQVPFTNVNGTSLLNKMKLFRIDSIVVNSNFTKNFIDKEYGVNSIVVYPPVPVDQIRPLKKTKTIVYVGRFSQLEQSKNQDVLARVFKKMCDNGLSDWNLVLAGGVDVGGDEYCTMIEKSSDGYPIQILRNPDFTTLKRVYGYATFFWSASGYGIDDTKTPRKVEHFGISVVEAMSAGCVPIVFSAGGHKETVTHLLNGVLWNKESELSSLTNKIIRDKSLLNSLKSAAIKDANKYSLAAFSNQITSTLGI
jgi:glycosyltransferase involved in cell wall biosynthesis